MPQSLTPKQFTMSIADGAPIITLQAVTVSTTDGWSILNRATLLVVDGPGEEGFLLPRRTSPDRDLARRAGTPLWHQPERCKSSPQVHE